MKEILQKIKPSKQEEKKLRDISNELISKIKERVKKLDSRIEVKLVGSCSRNTWLRYEKDLDIFLLFPREYSKKELEKVVENIGKEILEKLQKKYAEHPYVKGEFKGYDVELVPCYLIESPRNMVSSVDRTPFHDRFVRENIKGKEDEVRILKQFLKGISCYGAESKVEGFSGYLCELLIIKYGSFLNVLENATRWKFGEVVQFGDLSKKKLRRKFPNSPLIFVDPVDENRNVASALSEEKFARFVYAAKEYLRNPKYTFFFPKKRKKCKRDVISKFKKRGTEIFAIIFEKPDILDDILYPQLKKTIKRLKKALKEREFIVEGSFFSVSDRKVAIYFELRSSKLPKAKLHLGPFVSSSHEERFLRKYKSYDKKLTEPFIIGKRWAIILERKYRDVRIFISDILKKGNGIPTHIMEAIRKKFEVKLNEEAILDEFLEDLLQYFDPRFPWEN